MRARRWGIALAAALTVISAACLAQVESERVAKARAEVADVIARAGEGDAGLFEPLGRLGNALVADRRLGEAEAVFRDQLRVAETRFAAESNQVAAALYNVGDAARQERRFAEAEAALTRALAVYERLRRGESADAAATRYVLGLLFRDTRRPREAEAAFRRAIAIREKLFGAASVPLIAPLARLGTLLRDQVRYDDMEPVLRRQLAIAEARFPAGHYEIGHALYGLGAGLRYAGRYPEAEPLLRRAIANYESSRGPEHPDVAAAAYELGVALNARAQHEEAEAAYRRAIAIQERAGGSEAAGIAYPLARLGLVLMTRARFAESEAALTRAVAIGEKAWGPDDIRISSIVLWLGTLYRFTERFAQAEANVARALRMREAVYGPNHQETNFAVAELAWIAQANARYLEAEAHFRRVLASNERTRGLESSEVADILVGLAGTYRNLGRPAEALPLLERALETQERVQGPDHPRTALVLFWRGIALRELRQPAAAAASSRRALAIREKAYGVVHGSVSQSLIELAVVSLNLGRHREAEAALRRSLAINEQLFGADSLSAAGSYDQLARVFASEERFAEAEPLARRAVDIRERMLGPEHIRLGWSLHRLAVIEARQGKLDMALATARRTTALYRARAERAQADRSEVGLTERGTVRNAFVDHVGIIQARRELPDGRDGDGLIAEAFETAQLAQATGTESALARMAARFAAGSDALAGVVKAREDALEAWRAADQRLLRFSTRGPRERVAAEEARVRAELAALDARARELDARIAREFPEYGRLATPQPVPLAEVQALLGPDEALVTWLTGQPHSFVFAVRRDRVALHRIAISRGEIEDSVRALRRTLDPTAVATLADIQPFDASRAYRLYAALWAPVAPVLEGARNVFVVTDGALQSLPVGVLVTAPPVAPLGDFAGHGDVAWLARRHATTVLPAAGSLRSLRRFARAPGTRAREPFLGVGNPLLQGPPGATRGVDMARLFTRGALVDSGALRSLPPLPETAGELAAMARALGASEDSLLLGARATRPEVTKRNLALYRVIAFATHGLMAGEFADVGEPSLVLTPPAVSTAEDDGLLTASEIARLQLDADWVILSACNTAAPDGTPGAEGLSGLARAFFHAGARALFVSHWAVLSDATVKLTTAMLGAIAREPGLARAEAHRRAMLELMRDAGNPHYAHPMFWAPFVVVGEGGAR